ncbi:fatty acid desaturase [Pontiella agarivorans]|uniref:Fatty acid desaturase n=1 Tax=Pontiella agarivorans TaxID=3038953 RepID=A0ABU5MXT3_9BACT|nr:fatty acid desaturase [Pontiella agarivorans]MDZ8118980.1 fatty acid desaturase [Pontiella agarivorans]
MPELVEEKVCWYRSPIDKALRKKLMERSDAKGLIHVVSLILLSLSTGFGVWYSAHHFHWSLTLLALFVHGTCFTFLGEHAGIHELSHGTVFKTKVLNEFFLKLIGFFTWKNIHVYRASHTRHHMATVHCKQDLEVPLPYKVTLRQWIGYYTFDVDRFLGTNWQIIRNAFGVLSGDWENYLFPEGSKDRKKVFAYARIVLMGHLLIVAGIIYLQDWILLLLFTFPTYATWLAWLVTIPQHAGLQPDTPDFRLCCRSVKVDPFTLFLHWNMDYHVEHHMFAGVPFYNLPKLREAIKDDLPPMRPFFETWKEIRHTLKKQKTDPAYCYIPEIPKG